MVRSVETTDTLVIGAGAAGLATGQALAARKVPFVIVEQGDGVGWSWRNRYDRLHLHTAKRYSALPGLPFAREVPTYPSRQQVVDYLAAYADRFQLQPRFGHAVKRVEPDPAGAGWRTQTSRGELRSDRVVVATGFNGVPSRPLWPGLELYRGEVLHSADYRRPDRWPGKRVLVVGSGNSGAEIALDLVEHGVRADLCVRGKVHVLKRDTLGLPNPLPALVLSKLPLPVADGIARATLRLTMGDLRPYGLDPPAAGPFRAIAQEARIPLIDIGTVDRIKKGEIAVRKGIDRFHADGVTFVDGQRERYDAVILATGFRSGLDRFLDHAEELVDDKGRRRAPGLEARPGLFLVGFVQPATGLLREMGREARQVAETIARRRSIPKA
jgi:indole-3-pyruvate monooxygenase